MDEQRNKIIAGAVVITVLVVIGFLVILKSGGPKCELVSAKPDVVPSDKVSHAASSDNTALAYLDAYLEYELAKDSKEKSNIMPLQIKELKVNKVDTGRRVDLVADCAKISIDINDSDKRNNIVKGAHVELTLANGDESTCDIDASFKPAQFPVNNYSQCKTEQTLVCSKKTKDKDNKETTKTVGKLIIRSLQFELDGDAEKIKKGEFSKQSTSC